MSISLETTRFHCDLQVYISCNTVLLRSLEAKIVGTDQSILDSGSEIVAMPKQVWEDLSLPVWSDHVMTMSNATPVPSLPSALLKISAWTLVPARFAYRSR